MDSTRACEVCGAHVVDMRRGRCFACYTRWVESRPVGFGAVCTICSDRRSENLRHVEVHGAWVPLCFNCAGRAARLEPFPRTIEAIRERLTRDRRHGDRRSAGEAGRPAEAERRGVERRSVGHAVDGDMLLVELEVA